MAPALVARLSRYKRLTESQMNPFTGPLLPRYKRFAITVALYYIWFCTVWCTLALTNYLLNMVLQ